MNIYLAAQYSWRDKLKPCAAELVAHGFGVTSSWLRERADLQIDLNDSSDRFNREHAKQDELDIRACDYFILFTVPPTEPTKRGGRHWETGFAYALGKQIVLCGPRENIFHHLPSVKQFDDFETVLQFLRETHAAERR